jgi:hypothetical protein
MIDDTKTEGKPKKRGGWLKAGPGRKKGIPNKTTVNAREAISRFVDSNSAQFQKWLDAVANGIPDKKNPDKWIVQPNPEKAFQMVQSVVEYHIPKLARQEVVGDADKPIEHSVKVTFG